MKQSGADPSQLDDGWITSADPTIFSSPGGEPDPMQIVKDFGRKASEILHDRGVPVRS
jgi:hypothetical protein